MKNLFTTENIKNLIIALLSAAVIYFGVGFKNESGEVVIGEKKEVVEQTTEAAEEPKVGEVVETVVEEAVKAE